MSKFGKISVFTFLLANLENGNLLFSMSAFNAKSVWISPSTIKSGKFSCKILTACLTLIALSCEEEPKLENEIKIFGDKYRIDGELENFDNINIEITEGDGVEEIKKLIEKYIWKRTGV